MLGRIQICPRYAILSGWVSKNSTGVQIPAAPVSLVFVCWLAMLDTPVSMKLNAERNLDIGEFECDKLTLQIPESTVTSRMESVHISEMSLSKV